MENELAELKVMSDIAAAFAALEEDEVQRVLRWANEKYRYKGSGVSTRPTHTTTEPSGDPAGYADLPAFMDAARPANGLDRILAAAYFYQVINAEPDFDSQSLNTQLKHMGYPSANITRDIDRLVNRSPKFVIQTRKEGTSKQARKRFRLTTEGIRAVEAMLRKPESREE